MDWVWGLREQCVVVILVSVQQWDLCCPVVHLGGISLLLVFFQAEAETCFSNLTDGNAKFKTQKVKTTARPLISSYRKWFVVSFICSWHIVNSVTDSFCKTPGQKMYYPPAPVMSYFKYFLSISCLYRIVESWQEIRGEREREMQQKSPARDELRASLADIRMPCAMVIFIPFQLGCKV